MVNEKRKPHYPLSRLQELVRDPATRQITASSRRGAAEFNWSEEDIVRCIISLTHRDFYKSMTTYQNSKIWQDVYRPTFRNVELYVKLQVSLDEQGVVISFKQRQPGESL
jgi:motility quorum-sensing regulator / GCU-specific mRNA interferase toxin